MERLVNGDWKSSEVQIAEVSEDEISSAPFDAQPMIPRASLSVIAASFAGGQVCAVKNALTFQTSYHRSNIKPPADQSRRRTWSLCDPQQRLRRPLSTVQDLQHPGDFPLSRFFHLVL